MSAARPAEVSDRHAGDARRWATSRAACHDEIHATESLAVASRAERIVITADLDYPRLNALDRADRPGVVLFRGGAY